MRLSDIMGNAGLSFYAQVALVIFIATFVVIVIYLFARRNRAVFDRAKMMPLDDEHPQEPRTPRASKDRRSPNNEKHAGA